MAAYYNEIDPYAAQWLRNLIASGHIAPGDVDERSIVDVHADDLIGYHQCHFFAGIGGWSLALRLAGWTDNRSVWTGSCPCQPFSAAGAGKAADDKRHLWPTWFPLIAECRPPIVFGEQVEAAIGWGWLDAVFSDLEAAGYACGASVLPACGVGAPHIRQRLWFVADANGRNAVTEWVQRGWEHGQQPQDGGPMQLAHAGSARLQEQRRDGRISSNAIGADARQAAKRASPWDDCDWRPCTDGKARPVKSRAQRLANGLLASPSRLRPDQIAQVEKEIVDASHAFDAGKALHDLWLSLWPEAFQWTIGGLDGVHGAGVLLAFLRQLTEQGWSFSESISRASAQTHEIGLRGVRREEAAPCSSCGRGLDEQRSAECPNSLHLLSSILARHAQAAWGEAFDANAKAAFPLQHGVRRRPSKLRAYGNAIVPQVAAEFIAAASVDRVRRQPHEGPIVKQT